MRISNFFLVLLFPLVLGCKYLPPSDGSAGPASEIGAGTAAPFSETDTATANTGIRPKPRPASAAPAQETTAPVEPAIAEPQIIKSKQQVTCEKQGGNWGNAGKSIGKACIKRTRDAGKQCRKEGDCDSVCLARSRTCAPVKPLFGCNEILQDDGRQVTLCVD